MLFSALQKYNVLFLFARQFSLFSCCCRFHLLLTIVHSFSAVMVIAFRLIESLVFEVALLSLSFEKDLSFLCF